MPGIYKWKTRWNHGVMVLAFLLICFEAFGATPLEIFNKAKGKITAAKTLSADFTMKIGGHTVKGKICSKGSRFAVTSTATSNWYDGKDLYTYDSSAGETFIFHPSVSELAEVNPLLYLSTAQDYKITGSKNQKSGIETIVLIPKKSGNGVKSVTMELDSKTLLPKTIKIVPSSGSMISLSITNLKLNGDIDDSVFKYPKSKYPKAVITDMR